MVDWRCLHHHGSLSLERWAYSSIFLGLLHHVQVASFGTDRKVTVHTLHVCAETWGKDTLSIKFSRYMI